MAIRLRTVDLEGVGRVRVALCAVETDAEPGDVYLDDGDHYALAAKFSRDWAGQVTGWKYPEQWEAMDTQKKRDAREELEKWHASLLEDGNVVLPFGSIFWDIHAEAVDGGEDGALVRLSWGWTAGMSEEEVANLADDCPTGCESVTTTKDMAADLVSQIQAILTTPSPAPDEES